MAFRRDSEEAETLEQRHHNVLRVCGPDGKTIDLRLDGEQKVTIRPGAAG